MAAIDHADGELDSSHDLMWLWLHSVMMVTTYHEVVKQLGQSEG